MKDFFRIVRFIWNHPLASRKRLLALKKFVGWQVSQRIVNHPVLYPLVEDSVLLVEKGMAGATGNIYTGLLEFEEMAFVIHVLREKDLFGDIGANIGVFTILASKNAGARTIAMEPIASTMKRLQQNVELNEVSGLVALFTCGAGSEPGALRFTASEDTVNHVLDKDETANLHDFVEVPIRRLDEIFAREFPVVLKMDIEGFEWPALQGAGALLGSSSLKALIIELNGCGARYGYDDEQINQLLLSHGFKPFTYNPFLRAFSPLITRNNLNTIYIKDLDWAVGRCTAARKFNILEQQV